MKPDKKRVVFFIVFLLFAISAFYRLLNPFVHQETNRLKYTGEKPDNKIIQVDINNINTPHTRIGQFLNKQPVSGKSHKDLFAIWRPPAKLSPKKRTVQSEESRKQSIEILERQKRERALEDARQDITSYTWYGRFESNNMSAVFLAKDKKVLVAKTGDRLDEKYLIEDIQDKFLKIRALDLNEVLHLDIREFNDE